MNVFIGVILLVSVLISVNNVEGQSVCRAVTFSGAGDRGAVQAGMVKALLDSRPAAENQWQFATGISAGAINAATMCMFNVGDEQAASDFLYNQWMNISASQVYEDWPGGDVDGLLFKQGIWSTQPLSDYLHRNIDQPRLANSNRTLLIGATSLTTALFTIFNQTDPDIIQGVYASTAVPGLFEPVEKGGQSFADGGVTFMTPITSTARLCANTGADQIIIDVLLGVGTPDLTSDVANETTIPLLLRSGSIISHNIMMKDIETAKVAFPNAILNVFYPTQKLPGWFLGFDHSAVLYKYGYEDTIAELQNQKQNKIHIKVQNK